MENKRNVVGEMNELKQQTKWPGFMKKFFSKLFYLGIIVFFFWFFKSVIVKPIVEVQDKKLETEVQNMDSKIISTKTGLEKKINLLKTKTDQQDVKRKSNFEETSIANKQIKKKIKKISKSQDSLTRVYIIKSKEQDNLRNKLEESRSQLSDLTKNLSSTVKGQSSLRSSLEESQSQLSNLRNTVQRFGERLETYEERVGKHMISTIQQKDAIPSFTPSSDLSEKDVLDFPENRPPENAQLEKVRLEAARLETARLEAARLETARLETARLEAARLEKVRLETARIETARLEKTKLLKLKNLSCKQIRVAKINKNTELPDYILITWMSDTHYRCWKIPPRKGYVKFMY